MAIALAENLRRIFAESKVLATNAVAAETCSDAEHDADVLAVGMRVCSANSAPAHISAVIQAMSMRGVRECGSAHPAAAGLR
jgi:hypothetical protein